MTDTSIPLDKCPSEATLAEDIVNNNGVVILKAGTVLTERKIETLSKYGVANIVIKSTIKLTPNEVEEKMEKIEKTINKRMRRCEMTDEMNQFKNVLVNYYYRDFL